jgi:hypothetical protein
MSQTVVFCTEPMVLLIQQNICVEMKLIGEFWAGNSLKIHHDVFIDKLGKTFLAYFMVKISICQNFTIQIILEE